MNRFAGWVLVAWVVGCSAVQAKQPLDRWDEVENLQPGAEIQVRASGQAGPDVCLVSTVDQQAVTCLAESGDGVRLVYPRASVRDVSVIELAPNRHVGLWVAILVSAGLEIAACVAGGPAACFVVGLSVAAVWCAAVTPPPFGAWIPPPPPRPRRWRRRLVYQQPLSGVAP